MSIAIHTFPIDRIPAAPVLDSPNLLAADQASVLRRVALAAYSILDSAPETDFDNIVRLAARIVGTHGAAISFIDDHRQWFKAKCGVNHRQTPISQSFCAHTIESKGLLVVTDARCDPRFADNPLVTQAPRICFYAGMQIRASDGTPIAALCVFDPAPRPLGLTELEEATLRTLAAQVEALLELRRLVLEREQQVIAQSQLTEKLRHVAEHDDLTGLPQREPFRKRLTIAIDQAKRDKNRLAVLFIDVDHFKQVNDSLGHDAGDALLCGFAERLRSVIRLCDTAARVGGDEFGIILCGIRQDEEITAVVQSLHARLQVPLEHRGRKINCKASIGVAIYPDHADCPESLSKCADLALAEAKLSRGCAKIFDRAMLEEFDREARMLAVVREGLEQGRIIAHYQPKINLDTGALVGFEALARCRTADRALILPESFSPAFDDRELAVAISRTMITTVLDDISEWTARGLPFGHVAINTGAADFRTDDFAEMLLAEIARRSLSPHVIELEVTERVFLGRGAHHVARALKVLGQAGIRIALDDFGTGYASLTHLKQFRVDQIKIDRSFVAGIGRNFDDTAIVRALIGLGQSLGVATVAEGIETVAQAEFVRSFGCGIGQGYLFGAAQPGEHVPAIIAKARGGRHLSPLAAA